MDATSQPRTRRRDALVRRARLITASTTVLALGGTGLVAGLIATPPAVTSPVAQPDATAALAPAPATPAAPAAPAIAPVPRPKRIVYVQAPPQPAAADLPGAAAAAPPVAPAAPPKTAPPQATSQPPATTSSGS